MKIKIKVKPYSEVIKIAPASHKKPQPQSAAFRKLLSFLSASELKRANFEYKSIGMDALPADEPCLILMNHSSFIDLKIAATILRDRPFHIICTTDGFVGKSWLMRKLGCIPTRKFQTDVNLVRDMKYTLRDLKSSVLMFPEAGYSFDGTATTLPDSLGKCLKYLDVPVVMIKTYGAFSRDPLYNNLKIRHVDVSAEVEYILSRDDIKNRTPEELFGVIEEKFTFDSFKWQQEHNIRIDEPFRADYLNRVLYKCPHCYSEGSMLGSGDTITCKKCGRAYRLTEYGYLEAVSGEPAFTHIPDWFNWERGEVRDELISGKYHMTLSVDIYILINTKCLYKVGNGTLTHDKSGFYLNGCNGELEYRQKPGVSYTLNSDYYWYEIGDVICIGTGSVLYYCFPQGEGDVVAKARLATEELYKLIRKGVILQDGTEVKNTETRHI